MPRLEEGKLAFDFDDASWQVMRWDAPNPGYVNGIRNLPKSKAVDLIGIHDQKLFLIEVKDYRYYNRQKEDPPPLEFAWKVRDTIAGLVGMYRHGDYEPLGPFVALLANPNQRVIPILWLEDQDLKRDDALTLKGQVEKQLKWLHGCRPQVLHRELSYERLVPDLRVDSLIGGGQR